MAEIEHKLPGPLNLACGTLFHIYLLIGVALRFTAKGFQPELLIEIPSYRIPSVHTLVSKMWIRISGFLREALPIIAGAVVFVNIVYQFKLFEYLARLAVPVITRLWGMPPESVVPLLVGILRKDVALGMLTPLELSTKQLIIRSVLLVMFFPCIATFAVLFRELGLKDALKSVRVMLLSVFLAGAVLNLLLLSQGQ